MIFLKFFYYLKIFAQNHDLFWHAAATLQADVALTLEALQTEMAKSRWRAPTEWSELLRRRETETERKNKQKLAVCPEDGHLNPLVLLDAMDKVESG